MFGFVTVAPPLLSDENKTRYRGWYCGLCKALGRHCGQSCRLLLTYDMVFPAMVLSSVGQMPEIRENNRCIVHPLRPHCEIRTAASDYCADMNVVLSYYKLLDDWQDDKNPAALAAAAVYRSKCGRLQEKYPRQSAAVADCLRELSALERDGENNPDLPANCFGRLMGEIFVMQDDSALAPDLRAFGRALGRFIYIMDAATDLHTDLRRERYNPLVGIPHGEITGLLEIMGGDMMSAFRKLPVTSDRDIMENILCAGIWTKYQHRKGQGNRNGKKSL